MVRRELRVDAPVEQVWNALTSAEGLSAWFEEVESLDLRPGGRVEFLLADGRRRAATIESIETARALVFRWAPFERDADGNARPTPPTRVTFELAERDDGTVLAVTESDPVGAGLRVGA